MSEVTKISVSGDALSKSAEWIRERDNLIKKAFPIAKVESQEDLDASGQVQTAMSKHIKELEKARKDLTAPIDAVKKEIMDQEKELRKNLEAERDRLKALNDAYATRLAMEAQEARRKAEEEARRRAMEEAEQAMEAQAVFGDDVQVAVNDPVPEPFVPEPEKLSGNRVVKRWEFRMVDSSMVPTDYLILNDKAVRAYIKMQESMGRDPVLPGVKFEARMSVESK